MNLVDKSALVAEIERRINEINLDSIEDWRYRIQREHDIEVMKNILSLINTLEVKEVDNVWHDASETPKGAGDKEILVQFSDFHTSVLEIDDWEYLDHQTKWAYLKDLI